MTGMLGSGRRAIGIVASVLVIGGGTLALAAPAAQAAGTARYVMTTNASASDVIGQNPNPCTVKATPCKTIQHAVLVADPGDTVQVLDKGPYHESVAVTQSLTIVGQGSTGPNRTVVDGSGQGPSITVAGTNAEAPVVVTVDSVAVDGNTADDGIDVADATLHLVDASASGNQGNGVTVSGLSTLTVDGSTISHNDRFGIFGTTLERGLRAAVPAGPSVTISGTDISDNAGEGIGLGGSEPLEIDTSTINRNGDGGVVLEDAVTATVATSTFDGNHGAGLVVDSAAAQLTVADSTVSNTVPRSVEGDPFGAGVINFSGRAALAASTLVGNTGQGVLNLAGAVSVADSTINGTRVATNPAGPAPRPNAGLVTTSLANNVAARRTPAHFGAGKASAVRRVAAVQPSISVVGSIVAEQDATVTDCAGTITDGGYNLSSDAANSCAFSAAKHDQTKTDPLLGPLADNGGPTKTEILKKGSPAIDAIPGGQANCTTGVADQRGVGRPQPAGGKCDVGAVELRAHQLAIHPDSLPGGTVGTKYTAQIHASGGQYPSYAFSLAAGSLPDGLAMDVHGKITGTPTKAGTFHFTVSVNDPVLKAYTIVIDDAATNGEGSEPIAATGAPVRSMTAVGAGAVFAGFLVMVAAGLVGRRPGRHRSRR